MIAHYGRRIEHQHINNRQKWNECCAELLILERYRLDEPQINPVHTEPASIIKLCTANRIYVGCRIHRSAKSNYSMLRL